MSSPLEILDQQDAERAEKLKKLTQTPCYDHTQCGEDCLPDCPHYAEERSKPAYVKGPYGIQISEPNKRFWLGKIENGIVIETIWTDTWNRRMEGTKEKLLVNAERLMATLNACSNITTEALNMGVVKGCMQQVHSSSVIRKYVLGLPYEPDKWMGVPVYEEGSK
ncbi:hypothetical protein SDC9_59757 [bioreactor metagenome]|uniref:Uncharacterized protein n=1 Tax=bioreactor metagenome TaxID=1076179 RepID=A0A644XB10_9ZZZZ